MAQQTPDQEHHQDPKPDADKRRSPTETPGVRRTADTRREDQNSEHKGGASGTGGVGGTGGSVL